MMTLYVLSTLSSLKGILYGTCIGDIKGDTRSLDYSSHRSCGRHRVRFGQAEVARTLLITRRKGANLPSQLVP